MRYNGIQVGRVSKLDFDPNDPKRVIVTCRSIPTLNIHSGFGGVHRERGHDGRNLCRDRRRHETSPVFPHDMFGDYPVIRSKPSTLQQLEQSAPQFLAKINGIADRLNDVLSPKNRQTFAQTLTNLRDVTGSLVKDSSDFSATLKTSKTASVGINTDLGDLHTVLLNANGTTQKLDKLFPTDVDELAGNVGKLYDDLDTQVNGARIDQLMGQTRELLHSLTHLSTELDREPTRLISAIAARGTHRNDNTTGIAFAALACSRFACALLRSAGAAA